MCQQALTSPTQLVAVVTVAKKQAVLFVNKSNVTVIAPRFVFFC